MANGAIPFANVSNALALRNASAGTPSVSYSTEAVKEGYSNVLREFEANGVPQLKGKWSSDMEIFIGSALSDADMRATSSDLLQFSWLRKRCDKSEMDPLVLQARKGASCSIQ